MKKLFFEFSLVLVALLAVCCSRSFAYVIGPITGSSSLCIGSLVTLSDTTSGGVWTSGSSAIATVDSTGMVTGISAGVVVITYTFEDSFVATHTVTVNGLPDAGTISGGTTGCLGSTLILSDSVGGEIGRAHV